MGPCIQEVLEFTCRNMGPSSETTLATSQVISIGFFSRQKKTVTACLNQIQTTIFELRIHFLKYA